MRHGSAATRTRIYEGLRGLARCGPGETQRALTEIFAADGFWQSCHPFERVDGVAAIDEQLWRPLKRAFPDLERRDDIFLGGSHHDDDWLAATGHYFGTFQHSFLGIPPHQGWAYLRFGEFYKLREDRIAEAWVIFDLLDLMRQAGVFPWRPGRGVETLSPGPATHDGVRLAAAEPAETERTLRLVQAMLGQLFEPDRASMGMERFWAPDMMWYGPAMIGATGGIDGFFRYHTDPWVAAIPDWQADLDTPHFADGAYAAFTGWPSIHATHTGPLYGLPPTGRNLTVQLMDFWRRDGDKLAENWILIDFAHMFLQLGVDLFARMAELRDRPRSLMAAVHPKG